MIRPATPAELPRILEIRADAGVSPLTNPGAVAEADLARFIAYGALWVWQEADGLVTGFAAAGASDASVRALLVAAGHDGKGIGRALLDKVCDALREAGHEVVKIRSEPGSRAERHYRAAGWIVAGNSGGTAVILQKRL